MANQLSQAAIVSFLRGRNREGFDIYLWPYADRGNAGYILVDLDRADSQIIETMCADGHEPCLALQTSPGHLQAWVHVSATILEPGRSEPNRQTFGSRLWRRYSQRRLAPFG